MRHQTARLLGESYRLKYVQAASASNNTVMIHNQESLNPVFFAMDGIVIRNRTHFATEKKMWTRRMSLVQDSLGIL